MKQITLFLEGERQTLKRTIFSRVSRLKLCNKEEKIKGNLLRSSKRKLK